MKIAIITEGLRCGVGVDRTVLELGKALVELGLEVRVVCMYVEEGVRALPFEVIKLAPITGGVWSKYYQALKKKAEINTIECDLFVITSFPFTSLVGRLSRPTIIYDHGFIPTDGASLALKIGIKLVSLIGVIARRKADAIITISNFMKHEIRKYTRKETYVVYNGIDHLDTYADRALNKYEAREKLGLNQDAFILLTVSRLNKHARYKNIVPFSKKLKERNFFKSNNQYVLVGAGNSEDYKYFENNQCTVLGKLSDMDLIYAYQAADLYVSPSLFEGFNLPLLEAQWFDLPAVALDIGAHSEVILENKWLFSSLEDLAEFTVYFEPDKELSPNIKLWAGRFTWKKSARMFLSILTKYHRHSSLENTYHELTY